MIYFVKWYFCQITVIKKKNITLKGICVFYENHVSVNIKQINYKNALSAQDDVVFCTWVCVCLCHCECVRLVRARSWSGNATLVSLCHCGAMTWGGGVRTLWATPGAFSSDHNSSPRVTIATRSSSSEHQATDPLLVTVLSLERNRDTLKRKTKQNTHKRYQNITKSSMKKRKYCIFKKSLLPRYEVMWPWRQLSESAH